MCPGTARDTLIPGTPPATVSRARLPVTTRLECECALTGGRTPARGPRGPDNAAARQPRGQRRQRRPRPPAPCPEPPHCWEPQGLQPETRPFRHRPGHTPLSTPLIGLCHANRQLASSHVTKPSPDWPGPTRGARRPLSVPEGPLTVSAGGACGPPGRPCPGLCPLPGEAAAGVAPAGGWCQRSRRGLEGEPSAEFESLSLKAVVAFLKCV